MCDATFVQGKFGIPPERYADFKALTGDSSDNIKGAEKVGPKTAAVLLQRFGSLRAILGKTDEIEKPSIRGSVKVNAERLAVNYTLIQLDNKAPIPFALESLNYVFSGTTTNEVLQKIGVK